MPKPEKATFSWDSEHSMGFVYPTQGATKCHEVKRAKKSGKDYIAITEWRYFKKKDEDEEAWHPIKGLTVPAHVWEELSSLVMSNLEDDPATEPEEEENDEE